MNTSGDVIKHDYRKAKHLVENASHKAAQELARSMEFIDDILMGMM